MIKKLRKLFINHIPMLLKAEFIHRLPFLYSFLEIKPHSATLIITDRCNLRCAMCKQWRKPKEKELDTKTWKSIIDKLIEKGIVNIHFTGGEPLMREDVFELIDYASAKGVTTGLTTNGMLLDKDKIEKLLLAGIRSIVLSVDALQEKYELLRGVKNSYDKVRNAAVLLSKAKNKKKMDASVNFVLMKDTVEEFAKVKIFCDNLELPVFVCLLDKNSSLFDLKENKDDFWMRGRKDREKLDKLVKFLKKEKRKKPGSLLLNFTAIDYISKYFDDPLRRDIPCVSSQDRIFIDPYGDVYGGCLSMGTFGNIAAESFRQVIKAEKYKKAKRNMFFKKCSGCSCGYLINIRSLPHLILKDLRKKFIGVKQ